MALVRGLRRVSGQNRRGCGRYGQSKAPAGRVPFQGSARGLLWNVVVVKIVRVVGEVWEDVVHKGVISMVVKPRGRQKGFYMWREDRHAQGIQSDSRGW